MDAFTSGVILREMFNKASDGGSIRTRGGDGGVGSLNGDVAEPLVLGKDTDGSVPTHLSRSLRADRVRIEHIERLESDLDIAGSGMKAVHAMRAVVPRCNVYVRQRHVERADAVMLERDTM